LKAIGPKDVILMADETILRMFPPLRRAWAPMGRQAVVPITGSNARRVLFGTLNIRTGHRVLSRGQSLRQGEFALFLGKLRRVYRDRRIWLILDKHGSHKAPANVKEATRSNMMLLFLPTQCPELNAMDHLWKEVKRCVSANRQFATIDDHAQAAENWIRNLTPRQALRKAGILSKNFWLNT
jgi:transposase